MIAWKSFQRALKKCEKANIYWYQVLDQLHPLNGNVVKKVDDHCGPPLPDGAFDLSINCPHYYASLTDSFADDTHHAILKKQS